jgi:perosamine synthetase
VDSPEVISFRSCPWMGCSPAALAGAWLRGGTSVPKWVAGSGTKVVLTHQARTAIGMLCQELNLGKNDEVVLPSYNCGAEIDPFAQAGCKLSFYRIDRRANIDVDDIKARITPATRLVYVTHFFGWPQDLAELAALCRARGILLVEDCAQALFAESNATGIGTWGDGVIFSFVKFLPMPDGGALVAKPPLASNAEASGRVPNKQTVKSSLPLVKKWFMQSVRLWQKSAWTRRLVNRSYGLQIKRAGHACRPAMLSSNTFKPSERNWGMSRLSRGLLPSIDPAEVVRRRRDNFVRLLSRLHHSDALRPLHTDLPAGICPFVFPVFASDPGDVRSYFEANGIAVQGWPGYYPGVDWDDYPETCELKDSLLGLPIHQELDETQINYIADCANRLGDRVKLSSVNADSNIAVTA